MMIALLSAYFWLVAPTGKTLAANLQLLNDFAWITFIGFYPPGFMQNMSIGWCILTDRNDVRRIRVGSATEYLDRHPVSAGALLPFFHGGRSRGTGSSVSLVATAFFRLDRQRGA